MNKLSTLKVLPLVGLLSLGLVLTPAVALADKDKRERGHYSGSVRDVAKNVKRVSRGSHGSGRHYDRGHKRGHKKSYSHGYQNHRHGHKYKRHGHGHGHDRVIVQNHYSGRDYDHFRFLLGLHLDNVDIVFRDY